MLTRFDLLKAAVILVLSGAPLSTATFEYAQSFAAQQTYPFGWSAPVTVPFFDTAEGTLDEIRFSWEGTLTDSLYVQASDFFAGFSGLVGTVSGVSIMDVFADQLAGGQFAQTLYPVSLAAGESTTVGGFVTSTVSWVLNLGDSGFKPFGVLGATLNASAFDNLFIFSGMGGTQRIPAEQNTIGGILTVTYDYTPGTTPAVPEAGTTGAAVAVGALAVAAWRRQRHTRP